MDPYDPEAIAFSRNMAIHHVAIGFRGTGPVPWAYEEAYKEAMRKRGSISVAGRSDVHIFPLKGLETKTDFF